MMDFSQQELKALEHVINHKNLEPYFFGKLIEKKEIKWIELLKQRGFFDKTNMPTLSEGNYIEEWNILNYLKAVIQEFIKKEDHKSIEYILSILLQAAETSKNFRIFMQSLDIIKLLPQNYITIDYINTFLDFWLNCEFGDDYILDKVCSELIPFFLHDKAKALIVIEKFFSKYFESTNARNNYVLQNLLENKSMLFKIFSIDEKNFCDILVGILEKKSYVEFSDRELNEYTIKILNCLDTSFKVCLGETSIEKKYEGRINDIQFIKHNLNSILENVDEKKLDRTIKLLYGDLFNKSAFESIFDNKDYLFDHDDFIIHMLKICLSEANIEINKLKQIITNMLRSNYDIIKKIAIYTIVKKYDNFEAFLLELLSAELDEFNYIFRYYIYEDETKHIFEMINNQIEEKYILLLDQIILEGEYIFHEREDQNYELKWRQKRYLALKDVTFFKDKYSELKKITGADVQLSPAISFSGVHTVIQKSPYSIEEIIRMPVNELLKTMKEFKEHRFSSDYTETTYQGFGEEIKNAVISYPDYFVNDLFAFNSLQYEFIYYLLNGFEEHLLRNNEINYKKILDFINIYISSDDFWQDKYRFEKDSKYLMKHGDSLKESLDFMIRFLTNDKMNFNNDHLDLILKIINMCRIKMDFSPIQADLSSNNDLSFHTLNSLNGRYVSTLLEFALKIKRISAPDYETIWESNIKVIFEEMAFKNSIDFYALFGQYVANFLYIDTEWTENKISNLAPDQEMWQFFMSGYLDSRVVYFNIYQIMKKHYLAALNFDDFYDKETRKRLGSHLIIGYLNGFEEKIRNILTQRLFEIWDVEILEEMVRYCYSIEGKRFAKGVVLSKVRSKVLNLWARIIETYSNSEISISTNDIRLIKEVTHLLNNFSTLNGSIAKNLEFSFKYLVDSFECRYIIEYFVRVISKKRTRQKDLILSLVFEFFIKCLPTYPEDKIKLLLNYFKSSGANDKLDLISHAYISITKTRKSYVVEYISQFLR